MPLLIALVCGAAALAFGTILIVRRDGYRGVPFDPARAQTTARPSHLGAGQFFTIGPITPGSLTRLAIGLPLYGAGCALTVVASLGVDPWTVLADGIARRTGIGIGWVTNLLGAAVLLAWIPLRQRIGIGTVSNVLTVGTSMQITIDLLPPVENAGWRVFSLLAGVVVVAIASGVYLGAGLGAGPRDGLMTGLHTRFGWPIWRARATVELTVLAAGWLLGGSVGIGTIVFAVTIGPAAHLALRMLAPRRRSIAVPS